MKSLLVVLLALVASACSSANPTAPTPPPVVAAPAVVTVTYAINIPNRMVFQELLAQFPDGLLLAPMAAQRLYDYTTTYHMANVYYGPKAPETKAFALAGIVVAPVSVASQDSFAAAEWPNEYGQAAPGRVQWLGRFTYTIAQCQLTPAIVGCR